MSALSTGLRRPGIIVLLLAVLLIPESTHSAPVFDHDTTQVAEYDGGAGGCYYNFQRYQEGDRIVTNEPCLNCTCHNRMLMCYLRVCPFTKAIGQDCTVEKRPDQCCPVITCPEVPVQLLTSTTSAPSTSGSTEVGFHDNYGCNVDDRFYADGAQLPIDRQNPCELCYCIRNRTTCVMQECTLRVAGCRPIYQPGVCCPVRYNCEYDEELGTTVGSTTGLIMTTTIAPGASPQCYYEGKTYEDGELIYSTQPCQHCYCFRGDIACAVQDCGTPMKTHGKNCTALPPPEGECCPTTYQCDDDGQGGLVTVKDTEKQDVPKSEDTYTPNEVTEAGEAGEAGESQHPAEDTSTSFPIIDNIATEVHETKEENTQTPIDIVPSTEKASEVALPENIIPLEENVVPEIEGSKKTDVPEIHVTEVPSIISEAGEEPKTTEIPQISEEEKTKIIITTERSEELSTKSIEEDTQKITELPITEESSQASSTEEALQTEEEKTTEKSVIIEEQTEETSTKNALEIAQQTESPIAQEIHTVSSEPELQQNEKEAATPSHEATSTEITLNEEIPIQETINEVELPKVIEEETEQTETQSTEKIIEEKTTIKPLEHEEQATTQIVKNELPTETSEPEQETNVVQQSTEGQPDESSTSELELATKAAEIETARPSESTELPQISSTVQQHSLEEDEKKVEMIKPEEETTEGKLPTLGPKKEDVVPPEDITISEEPNVTKVQGEEEETVPSIPEQGLTGIPIPERVPELKAEDKDSVPEIQVTEGYVDMKGPEMHIPESLVTEAPKNVPSTYLPPTHEVTTTTEQEKLLPVTEESITKMHQLEENEPTVSAIPINHEEATTVGIASSIVPASEYSSTSESIPITKLQDQNDLEEEPKQPEKSEEHVTEIMHPELQSTEEISTDEELPTKGLTIKESGESSSEEISSEEHDVLPPKKDQITTEKTEQNVTLDESSTETISEISTISTNEEQSTKIPTVEETHTEENEKETSKIDVVEASTQGTISEEKSVETSTTPAEIPTTNEPTFDKEADQEQSTITLEEGEAAVTSTAEEGTEKAETEIPTKGQSSEAPQLGEEKVVTESIIPSEMPTKEIETQPTEEIPTEEYVTKPHFINTSESSVPEEQPEQTTISESASSEASPTVEIQTTISTIKEDKPLMAETQTEALLIEHTESSITDQPTEITQEIQKEEIPTDTTKTEEQNTEKAIIEEQPTEKSTIEEQLPEEQITQSSTNIQLPTEASIMERKEDEIPGKEVSTEKESEEQEIQKPSLEEEKATDLGIEEGKPTETPSKETVTNEIVTEQIFVDSSTSEGETSEKSETEQATELPTLHQISTESIKEVTEIPTVVAHPSTGSPNEEDKFTEKPIAKETQTEVSIQEEISTDKTLLQSSESTVQTEGSSLSTTESGPEKPIEEKILEEPANKITSTEESVIESSTKIEIPSEASTEITKIEEVTHSDIEMSSEQGPITQQEIEIHSTESTHLETKPSDEKEHTQPEPVIPDMSVTEKEHREPEISKDTETEIPIQELETTLAPTEEEVTILTSTPESTLTAETFTPTKEEIPVSMSTSEPALITETTSPKTIEQSTEQEIATTSQILPIDKIIPEQPMISHPSEGIPGEGNCLVDGQSYSNNSAIPPANPCQLSCHCLSSIIQCELVQCPPPPNHLSNCMPVHTGKDSCCPIYTCDSTSTIELESDNHMIEHHTPKYEEEKTQQTVQPIVPEIPMQESTEPSELVKEHSTISSETTAPIIPSQEHTVPSISSTEKEIPTIITETTIKSSESTSEEPTDIKEFTPDKTQDHFISSVPSSQEETSSQPSTEQPISISTSVISEKTEDVTQQEEQTTFSTSSENPIPNLTEEELSKPVTDEKHITPISTNITEEEQSIDENKIIPTSEVSQTESSILIEEHKNVDEEEIPGQGTIKPIIDGQETNEPATASEQPVTNIIEEKETPSPTTPEGHTITVEGPVKGSEVVEESQKPIKTSEEVSTSPVEFTSGQASEEKTSTVPEKEQKENVPSLEEQPVTPEEVTIQSEIHTDQPNEPEKQETTESAIEISTSVHDEKTSATYEPVLIEHETQNPIKSETSPAIELETSTEISIEIGNTIQKEQTNVPVESVSTEASESEHVEGTTIKTAADIEEKPETTVTNEPHVEGSIEMDTKEATLGIEEQTKETTSSPVSLEEENTVQVTTESAQELILTEEQTSLPGESITAQPESTEEPSAHETASPSTANTSESNITGETKITQPSLEEQSESTISTESQTLKPSFEQEQTTAEEYPIKSVTTQESVTEQATVSLVNEISPLVEEQPAERTTLKEEIVEQSTPETEITESVTEKELTTVTEQRPDVSEEQSIEKHTSAPISENEVSTESMENKIPEEEKEITEQTLTPIEVETQKPTVSTNDQSTISTIYKSEESATTISSIEFSTSTSPIEVQSTSVKSIEEEKVIASKEPSETILPNLEVSPPVESTEATEAVTTEKVQTEERKPEDIGTIEQQPIEPVISEETTIFVTPEAPTAQPPTIEEQSSSEENVEFTRQTESSISEAEIIKQTTEPTTSEKISPEEISTKIAETVTEEPAEKVSILPTEISSTELPEGVPVEETKEQEEQVKESEVESPVQISTEKEEFEIPKTTESILIKGEEKEVVRTEQPKDEDQSTSIPSSTEATQSTDAPILIEETSPDDEVVVTKLQPTESSTISEEQENTSQENTPQENLPTESIEVGTIAVQEQSTTTEHVPEAPVTKINEQSQSQPEETSTKSELPEELPSSTFAPTVAVTYNEEGNLTASSITPEVHEPEIIVTSTKPEEAHETTESLPEKHVIKLQPIPAKVPITETSEATIGDSSKEDDEGVQQNVNIAEIEPSLQLPEKEEPIEGQFEEHLQPINHTVETTEQPLKTDLYEHPSTSTAMPQSGFEYPEQSVSGEDNPHFPMQGGSYLNPDEDYDEDDQAIYGPGTCRHRGKVYVSAQQIPRDDPCDFCFCFRSDIICLQQSCPPPIPGCHEEPISGFCCPRYECPVSMATTLNITTTTTTTTTTLPPHFLAHAYKGAARRSGCQIRGQAYRVGEVIKSASGPCLHCTCGGDGNMKCDPRICSPEPMLRQMIAAATAKRRR